jgi:signal transduction histidine kinase/DNA-binding response OmpR family regulator/ligand-binding sensor domain-containing protein
MNIYKCTLGLLSILIIGTMAASNIPYEYTQLPNVKQLPEICTNIIMQDREGYMWYGIKDGGLCRDNGYQIDIFRNDRQNPTMMGKSNTVTCIKEDANENICFGTKDGCYVLNKNNYTIKTLDTNLYGKTVNSICITFDKSIWVVAEGSLYHYNKMYHRIGIFNVKNIKGEISSNSFVYEDSHHQLWVILTPMGLARLNKDKKTFTAYEWNYTAPPSCMVEDRTNHCFWIGTYGGGIVKYQVLNSIGKAFAQPINMVHFFDANQRAQTVDIKFDSKRRCLWQITTNNVFAYNTSKGSAIPVSLGYPAEHMSKIINSLTIDKWDNIWIAGTSPQSFILSQPDTYLSRHSMDAIQQYTQKQIIASRLITDKNDIWVYIDRIGLVLINKSTGRYILASDQPNNQLGNLKPTFIKCANGYGILGHSNSKIFHIWSKGLQISWKEITTDDNHISCICDDKKGHLYIGDALGLCLYNYINGKIKRIAGIHAPIECMTLGKDRHLYFCATNTGFMNCDEQGHVKVISEQDDNNCITSDANGTIWIGNKLGEVWHYNPHNNSFLIDEQASSKTGNPILQLVTDRKDNLCIVTRQLAKLYNTSSHKYSIIACNSRRANMNYFISANYNENCFNIVGAGGTIYVDPSNYSKKSENYFQPTICSYRANEEMHYIGKYQRSFDIPANISSVTLYFSTFDFLYASEINYSYRINGGTWQNLTTGINEVSLLNLSKGTYKIEIRATDSRGILNPVISVYKLHRLPAWWETWWAISFYIVCALLILAICIMKYIRFQDRKHHYDMEQRLTDMKFRFFTNISHELRTPLTLIITPLESLIHRKENGDDRDKFNDKDRLSLKNISSNAHQLLELINRLLDFRRLEMGEQKLNLSHGDIHEFLRSACEAFRPIAQDKKITFSCNIANKPFYMSFDSSKMHHIIYNILSNALKFTSNGGYVTVSALRQPNNKLMITVADTGIGIDRDKIEHIFERYYQANSSEDTDAVGSGIGLHIVHEFIAMHKGEVSVTSEKGKGSTFTIIIPTDLDGKSGTKDKDNHLANEIADDNNDQEYFSQLNGEFTLLFVDDNKQMLNMLKSEFESQYHILCANNGQEALDLLIDQHIDIIISDVMMPIMDGYELCRKVKSDVNTSHIHVILLTAKAAEESKLDGFKCGADAYVTKPFSIEMLSVQIKNMLEMQQKRMALFCTDKELKTEDVVTNPLDKEFLDKAIEHINNNLDNSEYGIEQFGSDMCMSRSSLYRKIVSITGQKPTEFIRIIRLRQAAKLLKEGRYSVLDVSYMVGFSSNSYFIKRFKELYGVSPSQFK